MVNNAIDAICGIQGAAQWTNCLKNKSETFSFGTATIPPT